eukprot:467479_1
MSTSSWLKELKELDNESKYVVFGYIRKMEKELSLSTIPIEISYHCLLFYILNQKYRVVIYPGTLCKSSKELQSSEIAKLPIGTVCTVDEIDGRRARISSPHEGWCSLSASDGRMILQRSNVKSAAMDKAIHAERARQTKVLILKSITTLNDATVTRILEKSDWNLRRAIEAFYIAKYKTQEYLNKKDKSSKNKSAASSSTTATSGAASTNDKEKKKQKLAWWKSWKTFANER